MQVLLSGAALSCSEEALSVVSMASTDPVFVSSRCKELVSSPLYHFYACGFPKGNTHAVYKALQHQLSCGHRNMQEVSSEMRKQFLSPLGDHITLLNVLTSYMKVH